MTDDLSAHFGASSAVKIRIVEVGRVCTLKRRSIIPLCTLSGPIKTAVRERARPAIITPTITPSFSLFPSYTFLTGHS